MTVLRTPKSMTGATRRFRVGGEPYLSVIVKATFQLGPGPMAVAAPEPIVRSDVHHQSSPIRSVRVTSDLAPYVPLADVVFVGHAHAGPRGPVDEVATRLALTRYGAGGRQTIFDKRIVVRSTTGTFERMPMMWEKAYGGAGFPDNPLGTGAGASKAVAPNLFPPDGSSTPICYAPIAAIFPVRRGMLPEDVRKGIGAEVAEIPAQLASGAGFPWGYFQAAPNDQRVQHLGGTEWIVLEGLHPALPSIEAQLPGARAATAIFGLGADGIAEGTELPLRCDTLRIDGDAEQVTVCWRGHFALPAEGAEERTTIVAALSVRGEPYDMPEQDDVAASVPQSRAFSGPLVGTMELAAIEAEVVANAPPGSLEAPRSLRAAPATAAPATLSSGEKEASVPPPEPAKVVHAYQLKEPPLASTFAVEAPNTADEKKVEVRVVDAPAKGGSK